MQSGPDHGDGRVDARGEIPMRKFMSHYVREKDVALFVELAKEPRPEIARRSLHARSVARLHLCPN